MVKKLETPYTPKGETSRAVRVFIDSKTWHPTKPGQLSFDAMIKECSDSCRVKVAGRSLNHHYPLEDWLVGAFDVFQFTSPATVVAIALIDPSVNLEEFAAAEGIRVEDIPEKT